MRAPAAVLCGLASALVLAGLLLRQGQLLALAFPLAAYLAATLLDAPARPRLRAERSLSGHRVSQGAEVEVRLMVSNQGAILEELHLEDPLMSGLRLRRGSNRWTGRLEAGGSLEFRYTIGAKRGDHQFQALQARAPSQGGLLEASCEVAAAGGLVVLPESYAVSALSIRPRLTRPYPGSVPSRQGGSGVEFLGLRTYRAGDDLRRVNRRAAGRHPSKVFVNQFEQERITEVGLVLDARTLSYEGEAGDRLFECCVSAAASLAEHFLAQSNRVGLLIYGSALNWTFPGCGALQRERILRELARAEQGASQVFASLDYLPARLFPKGSQLVLVSPLSSDDLAELRRLLARAYQVLVISPRIAAPPVGGDRPAESSAVQGRDPRRQRAEQLALRMESLERRLLLHRFRRAGLKVVDWLTERPLEAALQQARWAGTPARRHAAPGGLP